MITAEPPEFALLLDFVNSRDVEAGRDELGSPVALAGWLAAHGLTDVEPDERAWRDLLDLREALRALALAHHEGGEAPDATAVETVNRLAAGAPLVVRIDAGGDARLEPQGSGGGRALAALLAAVDRASTSGRWDRFKACPWDTCQWVFYDRSKNRSRTWCSMRVCGNRAKARGFRERQRHQDGS